MSLENRRIGFIGGGAMAEALAGGLLAAGVTPAALRISEPDAARRAQLESSLAVAVLDDNAQLVTASDAVVLAVKPNVVPAVLAGLASASVDTTRPLWISIAAGVTLTKLQSGLGSGARIVRSMPNTPALVGAGATGLCGNAAAASDDLETATALFAGVGSVWCAPEEGLLDAVTGLSGSGPAYVFAFIEALIEAGDAAGLPHDASEALTLQTVFGAAKLALESEHHPSELRRRVSSPGGTTLAGLARLDEEGFSRAVREAVAAATRRATELGGD
jgi:pyrroline-5-carboxylate reductase